MGVTAGVLFLCVANAARSQLAEGLARTRFGARLRVQSAGSRPSRIHPMAIEVMRERRIDLASHASKLVDSIDRGSVELVITLCAEDVCPVYLAPVRRLHWPIAEPGGDYAEAELRQRFRRARRQITARLDGLEAALALPVGTALMPASTSDRAEVEALLQARGLPRDGLDDAFPAGAVVVRVHGELAGFAAVETWDDQALLRSVAVAERFEKQHIGHALVADRLAWTHAQLRDDNQPAFANLALLTTSAEGFFAAHGFQTISRDRLPAALARSTQTQLSQCSTATAMRHHVLLARDEMLADGIATELAAHGTLLPPWQRYPDLPRFSIGWRMGYGEYYLWLWGEWFYKHLSPAEQGAYRARWEPEEPGDFEGWFSEEES